MNKTIHQSLANGRWQTFSIAEQLGNVGSEVSRSLWAKESGQIQQMDAAIDRALELFDLTINDPKNAGPRRREICRSREVFCDFFFGDNQYQSTPESLDDYFTQFALVARANR